MLTGRIHPQEGVGHQTGLRGHIDDVTRTSGHHPRGEGQHAVSDAQHIHVKGPTPLRRGGIQHGTRRAHPGVVAQDVNPTVTIPDHISHSTDGIGVGHIARLARHPVTDLSRQAVDLLT